METPRHSVSVRSLYEAKAKSLNLRLTGGLNGLDNLIKSPRVQKLGLALAGYTDYLTEGRVLFLGRTEANYLKQLSGQGREEAVTGIFTLDLCCIMVTAGLSPPEDLVQYAKRFRVPMLLTDIESTRATDEICAYLEDKLAPQTTIHGLLMEVFGLGVLISGDSGIGKSECGLDLVLRGHRLVTDDVVNLKQLGSGGLVGSGPSPLNFYMEIRGLGIINIRDLFGISSVSPQKEIDLAIELFRWKDDVELDRLGLEEEQREFLGTAVPLIRMPVASGRNLATLVEVAVRIHMLRKQGYEPTSDFLSRLEKRMGVVGEDF
jgi:HPr kinase/phosphorylase